MNILNYNSGHRVTPFKHWAKASAGATVQKQFKVEVNGGWQSKQVYLIIRQLKSLAQFTVKILDFLTESFPIWHTASSGQLIKTQFSLSHVSIPIAFATAFASAWQLLWVTSADDLHASSTTALKRQRRTCRKEAEHESRTIKDFQLMSITRQEKEWSSIQLTVSFQGVKGDTVYCWKCAQMWCSTLHRQGCMSGCRWVPKSCRTEISWLNPLQSHIPPQTAEAHIFLFMK